MRQTPAELFATVYRFYPRGLEETDPRYSASEEHQRLVQARRQAGAEGNPWRALLDRLKLRFPGNAVQNDSVHLPTGNYDAGYSGLLWLPTRGPHEENHQLGFLISFLVPAYILYSTANVLAPTTESHPIAIHVSLNLSPDEQSVARILTDEILAVFPGVEPMPSEIGNMTVPDVVDGIKSQGDKTLYQCLFTDRWWIRELLP